MKSFLIALITGLGFFAAMTKAESVGGDETMKIKLTFDDKTIIIKMEDNSASKQFIEMLPAKFNFIDFAGQEKIAEFPKPISLAEVPRGMIAAKGKMFIYAPWGNLGFFYKDHGSALDKNLIPLGEIESGLDFLVAHKGGFSALMENIGRKQGEK